MTNRSVPVGQVAEGQEVCILEAMKMQNSLVAAKVSKVSASAHRHLCILVCVCPFVCLSV